MKTAFAAAAGCDYRRGFQPLTILILVGAPPAVVAAEGEGQHLPEQV